MSEQSRESVQRARCAWMAELFELPGKNFVFIDETSTNAAMAREYGRSPSGSRCYDSKPKNWGKNITVIGALTLAGLEAVMTIDGSLNGEMFVLYVRHVLLPVLKKGDIVIADNLSVHKNREAAALIREAGADIRFLPAYSPDLNPIEKAWSKLKAWLRKACARSREAIEDALVSGQNEISAENALAWFESCGYRSI